VRQGDIERLLAEEGLDYGFNVDVTSYTGGMRHTFNYNEEEMPQDEGEGGG
jgi:hypothetical protein